MTGGLNRADPPVVAVTRPQPQADGTARRLEAAGYRALLAPLLSLLPHGDPGSADGIGALALTSGSAVVVLAARPDFHHLPVFAVGNATAAAARRAGFSTVVSASGDVEALLRRLVDSPQPVVHMAGLDHTGSLAERLASAGIVAERRIVYAMVPARALPRADRVDAVLLYSSRTAQVFSDLRARDPMASPWRSAPCVALSEAVAAQFAGKRTAVATRPDEDALFAALAALNLSTCNA